MGRRLEIAKALLNARRRSHWSRDRLLAFQKQNLDIAGHAIETSLDFESHFSERNALRLTLEQARAAAERELAGQPPATPGYSWGFSTGTMGTPGLFLTSESERNQWIGTVLARFLPLRMLAGCDVALILRRNNSLYTDVDQTRTLRLHYFDTAAPVDLLAEKLCSLAPQVLIGPPGVLEQLALSTSFDRRPFRPKVLLAGAEPLYPQDRALLTQSFGIAPRVIYQAKEGFLAAACNQGTIHLNEDLIHFEWLRLPQGRCVPVITDFTRRSQTYRRYRLDDILIPDTTACACGQPFTAVEAVEGRAQDVLLLDGQPRFPLEINSLLIPELGSTDYQLTQHAPDRVTIAVDGGHADRVIEVLKQHLSPAVIYMAEFQHRAPGEKRRRIRRLFDLDNQWLSGRAAFDAPF